MGHGASRAGSGYLAVHRRGRGEHRRYRDGSHLLLELSWRTALLWGAVLSSDRRGGRVRRAGGCRVRPRLAGALELESGLNDAPVVIAVVLLRLGADPLRGDPVLVVYELAVGAAVGALIGCGGAWALRRAALPSTGLYPLATLSVSSRLRGWAVAARLWLPGHLRRGAHPWQLRAAARGDVPPSPRARVAGPDRAVRTARAVASPARWPARCSPRWWLGVVLLLLGRPLSIVVSMLPFRLSWREQAFLSWSGLRGAVPIVLALIPLTDAPATRRRSAGRRGAGAGGAAHPAAGHPLPWLARLLRVSSGTEPTEVIVDSAPLDELSADLLQVRVPVGSKLHGVYLAELRLPAGATISLVVPRARGSTPARNPAREPDELRGTTADARPAAEQRIRAVDRPAVRAVTWRDRLALTRLR